MTQIVDKSAIRDWVTTAVRSLAAHEVDPQGRSNRYLGEERGEGQSVNPGEKKINLDHRPILASDWPCRGPGSGPSARAIRRP